MKFPIWPLGLLILIYIFYKMILTNSNLTSFQFDRDSPSKIFVFLLFFFVFLLFYIYQIGQVLREVKNSTDSDKNKFRLYSIIFSPIFFLLCAVSLINVPFSKIVLSEYFLELYTIFTFISILSSIVVTIKDIKLHRQYKHNKKLTADTST